MKTTSKKQSHCIFQECDKLLALYGYRTNCTRGFALLVMIDSKCRKYMRLAKRLLKHHGSVEVRQTATRLNNNCASNAIYYELDIAYTMIHNKQKCDS